MTCNWPLEATALPPEWESKPDAVKVRAHTLATNTLVRLTGHRVGTCPITIRPCRRSQCERYDASRFGSGVFYGSGTGVVNWGGTWSNGSCGCSAHRCAIELPGPVGRIEEVKVDGVVRLATDYRIDNGNELTWIGEGACPFPTEQDINLPDTAPGTMSVTYVNAYPPGPEGSYAVTVLANEFAQVMVGGKCRLPAGVTSVVRQGITMQIPAGGFPEGKTGILEVDAFIALWNPRNIIHPPQVYNPDMVHHRRIGG